MKAYVFKIAQLGIHERIDYYNIKTIARGKKTTLKRLLSGRKTVPETGKK
jgi:vacuolar-type H+-ATPase subunit C/Vma6